MVFEFFRSADDGLQQVDREVTTMLADCRHSFDLAMAALVTDGEVDALARDVRATDDRINATEENVRRELIVHTAVRGGVDVGSVLGLLLVVKKLERVGDQAKNILGLALEGVRFTGDAADDFAAYRSRVGSVFARAQELLAADEPDIDDFVERCRALMAECEGVVVAALHDEGPGVVAVPRAMLFRYLKRTVANVLGTVSVIVHGVDRIGDEDIDE